MKCEHGNDVGNCWCCDSISKTTRDLRRQLDQYREVNESVAVCAEHTDRMFHTEGIPCLPCALDDALDERDAANERIAELEEIRANGERFTEDVLKQRNRAEAKLAAAEQRAEEMFRRAIEAERALHATKDLAEERLRFLTAAEQRAEELRRRVDEVERWHLHEHCERNRLAEALRECQSHANYHCGDRHTAKQKMVRIQETVRTALSTTPPEPEPKRPFVDEPVDHIAMDRLRIDATPPEPERWTQEELDDAKKRAAELGERLGWFKNDTPTGDRDGALEPKQNILGIRAPDGKDILHDTPTGGREGDGNGQ